MENRKKEDEYEDLLDITHKQTPFFTRIEINSKHAEHTENSMLTESGDRKDYSNIDLAIPLLYFNSLNLSILDIIRVLLYLVSQKYQKEDFEQILEDAIKKTSLKPRNKTRPVETFELLSEKHNHGASNYASLLSLFFDNRKKNIEQYLSAEDFMALDSFFSSCKDSIDTPLYHKKESGSIKEAKSLGFIGRSDIAKIAEMTPLGIVVAQDSIFTNNADSHVSTGLPYERFTGSREEHTKKAPFQSYKEGTIAFNQYGNEQYIGYSPDIVNKAITEIASGKFKAQATLVFFSKKRMLPKEEVTEDA